MDLTKLGEINFPFLKADADLKNDQVHTELLKDLNAAGERAGVVLTITTAKSDHAKNVKDTDRTSRHMAQTAVDIAKLDGINSWNEKGTATNSNLGNPEFRDKGNRVKDVLVSMGYLWNKEYGNPKAVLWLTDTGGNHYNHLHVSNDPSKEGWTPSSAPTSFGSSSPSSTPSSSENDAELEKLAKQIKGSNSSIGSLEDLLKIYPPEEIKKAFEKSTFGMFAEEVKRIKNLMK